MLCLRSLVPFILKIQNENLVVLLGLVSEIDSILKSLGFVRFDFRLIQSFSSRLQIKFCMKLHGAKGFARKKFIFVFIASCNHRYLCKITKDEALLKPTENGQRYEKLHSHILQMSNGCQKEAANPPVFSLAAKHLNLVEQ